MIPYTRQTIDQSDIDAVADVLRSARLTQGDIVPAFERAICAYSGANHAVAVNSGTSALHIACLSLGLKTGDYLWTVPITFVASANCGLFCGAKIDFVDIDRHSWNIDVDLLEQKLEIASNSETLPKILVVVHMAGLPADMGKIYLLSQRYGFHVIEDASHALGATYLEKPVGGCQFCDITVFSFHPVKSITSGEGGMAVTNDENLARKMRSFAGHGITRDPAMMNQEPDGNWYYQQIELGYNYRMSDIHAALGLSQLKRLDQFIQRRQEIALAYDKGLGQLPLQKPVFLDDRKSAFHLYIVLLKNQVTRKRKDIFNFLREKGIGVNVHYIPVHLQPYYQAMGFKAGDFPVAESYYANALTLPCFPMLKDDEQQFVISALTGFCHENFEDH